MILRAEICIRFPFLNFEFSTTINIIQIAEERVHPESILDSESTSLIISYKPIFLILETRLLQQYYIKFHSFSNFFIYRFCNVPTTSIRIKVNKAMFCGLR